jgi:NADPH-dependent 2,4-dienoyl-CoA reductase/sulfur reductase-like enzyme
LVKGWIAEKGVKSAVVVGGGFIGLEMIENLVHLGLKVTLVEMLNQVGLKGLWGVERLQGIRARGFVWLRVKVLRPHSLVEMFNQV